MALDDPFFWSALLKIIGVNIILSGDNAVVIAVAARQLQGKQRRQAIFWGSAAAIVLLTLLTLFAVALLEVPYLKLVGAIALLWIGTKLLVPEDDGNEIEASQSLGRAIRIILVADLVMSTDNVIAVAAAAGGKMGLLVLGLAVSIPVVIFGATLLVNIMERWPILVTLGAGLIGFVAGEMAWDDAAITELTAQYPERAKYVLALAGAVFVVAVGKALARRALVAGNVQPQEANHPQT